MSDEKPKKKRFEGLIQFKEALRQTIVCLQASMEDRFASSLQSELVRRLDENTEQMHHLLFATAGAVGKIDDSKQMTDQHLLARIYQQQTEDLKTELNCTQPDPAHITVWLDPADPLITSYLFRLISLACSASESFDLKDCLAWGSVLRSQAISDQAAAEAFVKNCSQQYGFSWDRSEIMLGFVQALGSLLQTCDSIHLVADGSYVGLLIEGKTKASLPEHLQEAMAKLASSDAHTLAINCPADPQASTQFAMLMPIRLQSKAVCPSPLKGFVVLQSVRRKPNTQKNKLAG
ncbi:MAG TPA: hypothetical protein VFO10_09845 [Oligoflexus sp.]|uniref:hypothetical protein n=1 Tax=Oligoflexus sp. TaxID=1971216 RepID=UPI002D8089CF|nr:hypothetical protein [Oligoflexus sp.]HET9237542.1 hypothetical protein [Oligoflexus sp.]